MTDSNQKLQTEFIQFNGHKIIACQIDGVPHVAIKSICDAIGVHADSAGRAIKNDPILGSVHTVQHVRDASNRPNQMGVLPIEYVQGWLFSIDANKVKAEVKPILLEFKRECFRALHDYFNGSVATQREITEQEKMLVDEVRNLRESIKFLKNRLHTREGILEDLREKRFVAFRLFGESETSDEKLKAIFTMVDDMRNEPMLLN